MKSSHVAQARKDSGATDSVSNTFALLGDIGHQDSMARPHVAPGWSHLPPPFLQRCAGLEVETLTVQVFLSWLSQERQ